MALTPAEINRRYRERHPERVKASAQRFRDARRHDPEWQAIKRAQRRDAKRRADNIPPERWRGPYKMGEVALGAHEQVDASTFATWLRWWMATNDMPTIAETARQLGVNDKTLREALDGKRDTLTVAFVTRALDRTETGVWELYDPDTLAPLA